MIERGRDPRKVCEEINQLCEGKVLYSDCLVHDYFWLKTLFDSTNTPMLFRCNPLETQLNDAAIENWINHKQRSTKYLQLEPHRALNDAIIIANTFEFINSKKYEETVNFNNSLVERKMIA